MLKNVMFLLTYFVLVYNTGRLISIQGIEFSNRLCLLSLIVLDQTSSIQKESERFNQYNSCSTKKTVLIVMKN